jgi:hypothetical protein
MKQAHPKNLRHRQDGPLNGLPDLQDRGAKRRPLTRAELPRVVRKELATFARKLARDHRALFVSDPIYRKRAGQFLSALLPPKPRHRGRPGRADVTAAIRLLRQFRNEYPTERPAAHWRRVYPLVIPSYTSMSEIEQSDARQEFRERAHRKSRL